MTKKLRFAALIRVSTGRQREEGESLRTQATNVRDAVEQQCGVIVEWYGGQEHATPGFEKKEIDRLIHDAERKHFDAIMVDHADRWSRDNAKSGEGLDVFSERNIRFFVGITEYNLFDPSHRLFLEMSAVIGKFHARNQSFKSISNRIHRARRGIPTSGKLPFGRMFDAETGKWLINEEKRAVVEDVAKRYLAGEKMSELAAEYGMNHTSLHSTIMNRCGDQWEIRFVSKEFRIDTVVPMKVPALLPPSTIEAVRKRAAANKTYDHGQAKNPYLLTGFLFCAHCGYAMSGTPNARKQLYYRHSNRKDRECACPHPNYSVNAEQLEEIVVRHLFLSFGNPEALKRAIEEATPNLDRINEYEQQARNAEENLQKLKAGRQRVIGLVAKGLISDEDAEKELSKSNASESLLQEKIDQLRAGLENAPSQGTIEAFASEAASAFNHRTSKPKQTVIRVMTDAVQIAKIRGTSRDYAAMTWEEKRALVRKVFDGKTIDNKPMGIYVKLVEGDEVRRRKRWEYVIHGHLLNIAGMLPWSKEEIGDFFEFSAADLCETDYITKPSACVVQSALRSPAPALPARRFAERSLPPAA